MSYRTGLKHRYDKMWSAAIGKIRTGKIETDRVLALSSPDHRRGLTLISRPSVNVAGKVMAFLQEVRDVEPRQYYYPSADLHITILSLFTATVEHQSLAAQTFRYAQAVDAVFQKVQPFRIEWTGVTTSAGAIMIQGFPDDETINEIRNHLRRELRGRGLNDRLDTRYRLETAHMTFVRFRGPLQDSVRLAAALERARNRRFGATIIREVHLVKSDWYMSHQTLDCINTY